MEQSMVSIVSNTYTYKKILSKTFPNTVSNLDKTAKTTILHLTKLTQKET